EGAAGGGEVRPVDGAVEEGVGAGAGRDGGVRRRVVGVRGDRGDVGLLGDGEAEPAVVELPVAPDEAEPGVPLLPDERELPFGIAEVVPGRVNAPSPPLLWRIQQRSDGITAGQAAEALDEPEEGFIAHEAVPERGAERRVQVDLVEDRVAED